MSTCKRMWTDREIRSMAGDTAKTLIEGGQVENAKPVYCHPLEIYASGVGILTALLFNNSSEKINTWAKLKNAIRALNPEGECRLLVSGGIIDSVNEKNVIGSEIYTSNPDGPFILIGFTTDGTIYSASTNFVISDIGFDVQDDVNKLN